MPLTSAPLEDADLCVKCGLCLPHCPTYRLTQHEGDSPRGRIALMQGLATKLIPLTPKLEQHLDSCLGCRACETVCPAKVPYGRLIDAGRELLLQRQPHRARTLRWLTPWLVQPALRNLAGLLLWLYQRSGLQWLIRRTHALGNGRLARLESLLPRIHLPLPLPTFADQHITAGTVSLFIGCTGELADRETLQDAIRVLQHIGVKVEIPHTQVCCGALHQHVGLSSAASQLAHKNIAALATAPAPIVVAASGCAATLLEYSEFAVESGADFSARVQDLNAYLLQHWPASIKLKPLKARVALHTPCTMQHVVKQTAAVKALLLKIPGVEIVELDTRNQCCGAAGSYFIRQPVMADQLLASKLEAVKMLTPDYIVSSNIGCSLHLAAGLRRGGVTAEVLHPVSLLARHLPS